MRFFIALNLPQKERQRIHAAARPLREEGIPVRWIEPDDFHVTLKFLGEVRREVMPGIEGAAVRVASETRSFATKLGGFGAFPTVRHPRVIWLGVEANAELRCLKQDVEWALGDVGFEAETRAFHPHVTLGRVDDRGGAGVFRGLDEIMARIAFRGDLNVHSLDLMRSHGSGEGARYSIVSSAKLTGS